MAMGNMDFKNAFFFLSLVFFEKTDRSDPKLCERTEHKSEKLNHLGGSKENSKEVR